MIFSISNGNKRDSIIYTIKIIYRRDENNIYRYNCFRINLMLHTFVAKLNISPTHNVRT